MVDAADGPSAIQSALDSASAGETVQVTGSGEYTWSSSIEVPNGVTLSVSNDVSVTVPSSNNVTGYPTGSRQVYSLITCQDRSSASNVTIEGGSYDLSEMSQADGGYAGVWLHNASDSTIANVAVNGTGAIDRDYRGFGIALTRCTNCEIRDSEAHNASYDNIAVRGGCQDCLVLRSGGTNGSSGTIQTARWGYWDLNSAPDNTEFRECWGRRIYCHDGSNTTWNGCQSTYRLQTLGTDNAHFLNSGSFEGTILIYTLDSDSEYALIESMEFVNAGEEDVAITVAPNSGQPIGTVEVDNVWAERPTFLSFENDHIDPSAGVGTVEVTNSVIIGAGSNASIIGYGSSSPTPSTVVFRNCEFYNFQNGFDGNFGSLVVENCEFHNVNNPFSAASADVQRSGNTFGEEAPPEAGDGDWVDTPTGGTGGGTGAGGGVGDGMTATRSIITYNDIDSVTGAANASGSSSAFTFKKTRIGPLVSGEGVAVDGGGDRVEVRQCTFEATDADETANVHIYGVPTEEGLVEQTWHFMDRPELAIRQSDNGEIIADAQSGGFESVTVQNNAFGEEAPSDTSIGSQQFE